MWSWFRKRRRRRLIAEPFPAWWEAILTRNVDHYRRLTASQQASMRDRTRILVAEMNWESAGGLHVTDEIKITIAAQASLLLDALDPQDFYSRVSSIVVYPGAFRTPNPEDGWEDDELSDTISEGQAVYRGPVILSWENVLQEARDPSCGHNVVIHEFAHQIDYLDNNIDGTPPLKNRADVQDWIRIMTQRLDEHRRLLAEGAETFFTDQAGDNETEFFADASEAFFCQPWALFQEFPDIFELLQRVYQVDPKLWFADASGSDAKVMPPRS